MLLLLYRMRSLVQKLEGVDRGQALLVSGMSYLEIVVVIVLVHGEAADCPQLRWRYEINGAQVQR